MTPFTLLLFALAAITAVVELLSDSGDPTWWLTPLIASMWIPFIPMLPVQLILLGMVSEVSCACMPFDKADAHMIEKPVRFDVKEIRDSVFCFGPLSSIVDLAAFALLLYFVAPGALLDGSPIGNYSAAWLASPEGSIETDKLAAFTAIFQTGFFLESLVTQNVVYLFLRTDRLPLVVSRPSLTFGFSIALSVILGFFFVYVPDIQSIFSFASNPDLPWVFLPCLVAILAAYLALTQLGKRIYKKKFGKLL